MMLRWAGGFYRVQGESMAPNLRPGQVICVSRNVSRLHPGDMVVIRHDGLDKIKRLDRLRDDRVFVLGDNPQASTDSRDFGWLERSDVIGRVIWPRVTRDIR